MQASSAANIKRREKDVMRLLMSGKFQVHLTKEDSTQEFEVLFEGPEDSLYHGVSDSSCNTDQCLGFLDCEGSTAGVIPLQVSIDRLQE